MFLVSFTWLENLRTLDGVERRWSGEIQSPAVTVRQMSLAVS